MARNKITDLNDHLFAQIERLTDEDLDQEKLDIELKRSKALTGLSSQVIGAHRVVLDAAKLVSQGDLHNPELKEKYGLEEGKK